MIPVPTGFTVFCLYIFRSDSRSCRFYSILFVYFQERRTHVVLTPAGFIVFCLYIFRSEVSVPAGFVVFCLYIFRSEGCMSENVVPVPAEGAARPSRKHHEGNQPATRTTPRHAFSTAGGELVSLSVCLSVCLLAVPSVQLVESW